ncbi:hypothetical protein Zmor_024484 [Zophobas morio]|uniref:Peptidase M14 domain-containing protein n=1 Tax=Zophobas morio TaxID=2755281 RepID=A0AA38M835_9CUCU|nr:hypothetical protein Zmor_024484 [Zophobas morio]
MCKRTEKCFYTILIITLIILAVLVPIMVIQIGRSISSKHTYLSPYNETEDSESEDAANEKYYTPSELSKFLKQFANQRSFLFTTNEIGRSKKGHPIDEVVLKQLGSKEPIVLTVSGLLASDWLSIFTTIELMNKFFADVRQTNHLLKKYCFHFLPLLDPDGYEFSQSLPIYSNWNKSFEQFKDNEPSGDDILNGFGSDTADNKVIKTFKNYFSKNKNNIKAVFFLFSPQEVNFTSGFFTVSHEPGNDTADESRLDSLGVNIDKERDSFFKYLDLDEIPPNRIDAYVLKEKPKIAVVNFMTNFRPTSPELLEPKSKKLANEIHFVMVKAVKAMQ